MYKCSVFILSAVVAIIAIETNSTYSHGNSSQNDTQHEGVDDVGYDQPQGIVGVPLGIVIVFVGCAIVVALYWEDTKYEFCFAICMGVTKVSFLATVSCIRHDNMIT